MKSAVHALTIVVFLLFSLAAFAAQRGKTPHPAIANSSDARLQSALAQSGVSDHQLSRDLFMPVPMSAVNSGPSVHGRVESMSAGYSSAVPLLSCIGAGMAIGGLVSVRLTRRLHR